MKCPKCSGRLTTDGFSFHPDIKCMNCGWRKYADFDLRHPDPKECSDSVSK